MKDRLLVTFLICAITLVGINSEAQSVDTALLRDIKVATIKNLFFRSAISNPHDSALFQNKYFQYTDDGSWFRDMPGFGYLPVDDLIVDISTPGLQYPDPQFHLFAVRVADKSDFYFKNIAGLYLVGVNDRKQFKYISGAFLRHNIAADFKFKKRDPESYLPFLKIRFYDVDIKSIKYTGKTENELFVYECISNKPGVEKVIIKFNPDHFDKTIIQYIDKKGYKTPAVKRPAMTQKQKEAFLLNEVMKNIYTYRLNTIPGLLDFSNGQNYLKTYDLPFDTLIPDYDEVLTFDIRRMKNMYCVYSYGDESAKLYDGDREKCFLEIYSVTKVNEDLSTSPYVVSTAVEKDSIGTREQVEIDANSQRKSLSFYEKRTEMVASYLLAYDTATREVFYVSGNFYQSKVLHLYRSSWLDNLQQKGVGWRITNANNFETLNTNGYISDRLHSYNLVKGLEKIIKDDKEGLIIEATSRKMGKSFGIRARIDYQYPEVIIVTENK
jgi:hypothetical protein